MAAAMGVMAVFGAPQKAQAYDIDCAIMLCMAGGFPPSAVCARAYRTMIRRITPWPSLPPFGVCTFAHVPVELGGPGGEGELDTNLPEYEWLNRTHVIWFDGWTIEDGTGTIWEWSLRSCDRSGSSCRELQRGINSKEPWPVQFPTEAGQIVGMPLAPAFGGQAVRGVLIEFGTARGDLKSSEWIFF